MKKKIASNGIYYDRSTKGDGRHIMRYRGEVRVDGRRVRKRFESYRAAQAWIAAWQNNYE